MGLAASVVRKNDDCYCNTLLDYNLCLNDCVVFELNEKFIESKINELDEIEAPRRRADGESSPQGISSVFNLLANPAASPPRRTFGGNALAFRFKIPVLFIS